MALRKMEIFLNCSPLLHEAKQIELQMRSLLLETRKLKTMKKSDDFAEKETAKVRVENKCSADEKCIPDENKVTSVVLLKEKEENTQEPTPSEVLILTTKELNENQSETHSHTNNIETTESPVEPLLSPKPIALLISV